ncbi:hypothetical protein BDV24DRAFT_129689 [Aspergillus arachidicola]|uniref:Uncharacterized protein n=1 Tax=Aspergillus arachidicola TaxID=656916 RepID=A0A5N6YF24_9EURO|nr:hypothetical protein BDV24DRAFT_129689 [Aspergillus arachidicola]
MHSQSLYCVIPHMSRGSGTRTKAPESDISVFSVVKCFTLCITVPLHLFTASRPQDSVQWHSR